MFANSASLFGEKKNVSAARETLGVRRTARKHQLFFLFSLSFFDSRDGFSEKGGLLVV